MDVTSFALHDFRKKNFNKEVWIPLRVALTSSKGHFGSEGYSSTFYGAASVAVPLEKVDVASKKLNWNTNGLGHDHGGYVQGSIYHPAELFHDPEFTGVNLVISQRSSNGEPGQWHLNPDLVTTLNLRRQGQVWLATEEGYIEVIRVHEADDGSPQKLEIRSEFLKDYLNARGMALCISLFAEKEVIVANTEGTDWTAFDALEITVEPQNASSAGRPPHRQWLQKLPDGRWEGSVVPIHEGGHPFGSGFAIFHAGRKNLDVEQSVPEISHNDEMETSSHEGKFTGRLLYRVWGEVWRDQWVQPAPVSTRVKGDKVSSTSFFIVDAEGTRASDDQLRAGGRWLWFNPSAIQESLAFRGSSLLWYTRETGRVSLAQDGGVVFGVNPLGLVNVYAKDIAYMPPWQQRIWSGFNIAPDGGVCRELLASQGEGVPANTLAPEAFLLKEREALDQALLDRHGYRVFRGHADVDNIAASCHRFRALDRLGLLALAKDLARITVDDIDQKQLQKIVPLDPAEKRGSLKSLERVIAKLTDREFAAKRMKAFFAIYELRLADAHLAGSETDNSLQKLELSPNIPYVLQGRDMLIALVDALHSLAGTVRSGSSGGSTKS